MTPVEVRRELANALNLDLVGPDDGLGSADEALSQAPARWYLTGFLVRVRTVNRIFKAGHRRGMMFGEPS